MLGIRPGHVDISTLMTYFMLSECFLPLETMVGDGGKLVIPKKKNYGIADFASGNRTKSYAYDRYMASSEEKGSITMISKAPGYQFFEMSMADLRMIQVLYLIGAQNKCSFQNFVKGLV